MEQEERSELMDEKRRGDLPRSSHALGAISRTRKELRGDTTDEARRAALVVKASVESLSFYYGSNQALKSLNLPIAERQVTALIGPSGCGKSTFLRCFNRMHDLQPHTRYEGRITLHPDNLNLISREIRPIEVRMRIGMVFQRPNLAADEV